MNPEIRLQRFEQQLNAFEKLHTDELKKLNEKLVAYLRLQAEEVKFLREELAALKKQIDNPEPAESSAASVSSPSQDQPSLEPATEAAGRIAGVE